jgi:ABC-type multidrug transport system fused ATPase/permease subunit
MRATMARRTADLGKEMNRISHERVTANVDMSYRSGYVLNGAVVAGLTMAGVLMRNLGVGNGGNIVAALMYSGGFRRAFDEILRSSNDLIKSTEAMIVMEEIFNGYAREEEALDKKRVGASTLRDFSVELTDVSLEVDGKRLLDRVSFRVPPGGVVRLEGRSGEGKTTLSRVMSGYFEPTGGTVKIGGEDIRNVKRSGPDSLYAHVAYLSQHPYIFANGNLRENLAFGNPNAMDEDMGRVLDELGLSERFIEDRRLNLAASVRGLSGGEEARLGLARVLLKIRSQKDGSIVFLDQATEELDEVTEAMVAQILLDEKRARPNTTFVIISHRSDFIRMLENPEDGGKGFEIQRISLKQNPV